MEVNEVLDRLEEIELTEKEREKVEKADALLLGIADSKDELRHLKNTGSMQSDAFLDKYIDLTDKAVSLINMLKRMERKYRLGGSK